MALLSAGDPAPNFELPRVTDGRLVLYGRRTSGRRLCMVFCGTDQNSGGLVDTLRDGAQRFADAEIAVLLVIRRAVAEDCASAEGDARNFFFLSDPTGAASQAYGVAEGRTAVFLVSPNLRIIEGFELSRCDGFVDRVVETFRAKAPLMPPVEIDSQAPVLVVPDVLDPETCRRAIHVFESQGHAPSGFSRMVGDVTKQVVDHNIKKRSDHFVSDKALLAELQGHIARRIVPEIQKAFNFQVTRLEDFRIGRYDADGGGYFRVHRDNTSPGTAHRRWAMSLNLNSEDYEGGHLCFPEYGSHMYKPATGGAIVFSCSLLHEARDVLSGSRYVLLAFMYSDKEVKLREDYRKRVGMAAV